MSASFDEPGRQHERRRRLRARDGEIPAGRRLRRIRRTERVDVRQGAPHRELLNRLMRRAVFADTDAVMREDVRDRQAHERCEACHRLRVIREDEERRDV